jgi:predicted Zn finger-like uncharacterized protein
VVVQCPTCQSKFRIADEKVTDRGVRVRCTACKNVFQVKKPGSGAGDAPGPGTTMDLSSLGAAAVKSGGSGRPPTGPVRPATGPVRPSTDKVQAGGTRVPTDKVHPAASRPSTDKVRSAAARPSTDKVRAAAARPGAAQSDKDAARRLDVDDLFGMAELTGDAPLAAAAEAAADRAPAASKAAPSLPGFDDLELEFEEKPAPKTARPPSPPPAPDDSLSVDPLQAVASALDVDAPESSEPVLELADPFAAVGAADSRPAVTAEERPAKSSELRPRTDPVRPRTDPMRPSSKPVPPPPEEQEMAPGRALISSALTGFLGATLAIVVVIAAALSDENAAARLGFGTAADVVATGVVSGIYDTAGGKPVYYVRGRVENRSDKVRGPVRVTAELVGDGAAEAKADAIAGSEPTPEDVWSVRSAADVEKLTRTLQSARVERKIAPGASLPFFAVIPDPPADLVKHRLHISVDTVEAWRQPGAKASRDR